jgi:hypothetical protein
MIESTVQFLPRQAACLERGSSCRLGLRSVPLLANLTCCIAGPVGLSMWTSCDVLRLALSTLECCIDFVTFLMLFAH